ncbi:type IX secretion system protein PorQ [Spirosoma arcticum]
MRQSLLIFFLITCLARGGRAQPFGGQRVFSFLDLPTHARVAALGGQVATATRPDAPYFLNNPALADSLPDNQLAISLMPYLAAAKYYTLHYSLPVKSRGMWAAGLQYLTYGQFELTDPAGNALGTFTANDYALSLTHARTEGNFTLGATIKAVGSAIETYSAFGVLADFGGIWRHPKQELTFGLVAKNVGYLFMNYGPTDEVNLPFDLQAGVTLKPRYAPIRLTLTAHHLQRFDITYNDPTLNVRYDLNGNPIPESVSVAEKVARHLSVGAELLISRNVHLLVGYNHQKRQEGKLTTGGIGGVSFGASVQARGFQLTYGRFSSVPTAGTSQLSLRIDLDRLLK